MAASRLLKEQARCHQAGVCPEHEQARALTVGLTNRWSSPGRRLAISAETSVPPPVDAPVDLVLEPAEG